MELRNIMGATRTKLVYVTRHASSKRKIPGLKSEACAGTTKAGSGQQYVLKLRNLTEYSKIPRLGWAGAVFCKKF